MKATTFVLRQHQKMREMIRRLEREPHARAPMLVGVVEEILSFIALEEDLFYPAVAELLGRELAGIREESARLQQALLDLLGAERDDVVTLRVRTLARLLDDHARNDAAVLPLAERALGEPQLEELGARMARFSADPSGTPRGSSGSDDGSVTFH